MTDENKNEVNEVINELNKLFIDKSFNNMAVLNALSIMSVHLGFVFGIPKDVYLKDIEIMFEERVKRAVEESKQ